MKAEIFFLYFVTWSLVALTPGPAVMCAMTQATRYGFRHSLAGIAGIQLGHFVFYGCVAFGLAAVLSTATIAFTALRFIGAAYLIYLGVRAILSSLRSRAASEAPAVPPPRRNLLLQGFGIQITNPKGLLFTSALLPQFIQPQHSLELQLAIFLVTTIAVDVVVLGGYAYFAARGAHSLRVSGINRWLERVFGAALVLFGVRVLATRN